MPRKTGMEGASYGPDEVTRVVPVDSAGRPYTDVEVMKAIDNVGVDIALLRRTQEVMLGDSVNVDEDEDDE